MAFLDIARKKAEEEDEKLRVFLSGTTVNTSNTKNTTNNTKNTTSNKKTSGTTSSTKTTPKAGLTPNKGKTPILDSAFKAAAEERKKYESRTTYGSAPKSSYIDFNTETKNAYTSAKNKASTKTTITSNLSEKERKARIKEIEAEQRNLAYTLNGLGRAGSYGGKENKEWLKNKSEEVRKRQAELSEELKQLKRVGTFTASELKQFEIEDAKAKKAALPNYNPTARVMPHQVESFKENVQAHLEADKEIDLLKGQKSLYKNISKFGDVVNDDNFGGQTKANYRSTKLSEQASLAMNDYITNPTAETRELAMAYDAFVKEYMKNNEKALDDEGQVLPLLSKNFASYVAQQEGQAPSTLLGGGIGALFGMAVGNPRLGMSVGGAIGSGEHSYKVIRGSMFSELLSYGLDEQTAYELANNDAFIEAAIEGLETGTDLAFMLGSGTLTKFLGKGATKATAKAATKAAKYAAHPLKQLGLDIVLGTTLDAGKEGLEEGAQASVSRATREKAFSLIEKEVGQYGKGNIDLYNRPIYKNADGTSSTVDSVTVQFDDGKFVLLPSIVRDENGKATRLEETDDIVAHYIKTGEHLGEFDTLEEANIYANKLHYAQMYKYTPDANKTNVADNNALVGGAKVLGDAIFGGNTEALKEIGTNAWEGTKTGFVAGGMKGTARFAVKSFLNAKTYKARNEQAEKIAKNDEQLDALVTVAKAMGEGTVASEIAQEVETARENGEVTSEQVKKLIASNKIYIQEEARIAKQTTTPATLEQAAIDVVNERNRTSTPSYTRLEALSRSNEPIAVEDVKKVTGFGDEGSKLVAEIANSEGVTFSQVERAVKTAYMAGFTNVDSAKVSFETDTQIDAYTAGRKDRAMQDLAANERAKKADSYNGSTVETEAAISPEEAQRYNIMVSNLKRKAENMGLLDDSFFTKLQNVNLYNPTAIDRALISSEFRRVFAGNTDPLVTSWLDGIGVDTQPVTSMNEQNMHVSNESGIKSDKNVTKNPGSVTEPTESVIKKADSVTETPESEENTSRPSPEPEAQRYDIPEGSEIVNNIVVDEHSKRLKRENPRAYSNIIRMAKRLRMKVRFVKNLVDEKGNVLEGLITSKGIFINADAKNPSRFVATHEFGHRMKQAAPREWAAYQEYVINKLKRERFGNGRTAYDVLYEETKNAYGKDDADSINEEIAVNYAGELFDSEEMLESFIREDKSLAHKVRDWWYNVLESLGLLSEKKKAQQLWLKAYTAAGKNVKEGTVGEYSGERYSKKEIREIFKEQVIDAIHNPNKIDGNNVLVGYTTSILKQLGLNDRLMCITKGHVRDINTPEDGIHSEYHGLTEQEIYDMLPTILEYPAIVFDSISKQNPNAVCILSEKTTKSGLPIIVAINPDGKGRYNDVRIISNFVLSTYGKNNPMGYLNELSKNSGKVLYINEFRTKKLLEVIYDKNKRTKEEFKGARLQLPAGLNNLRFNYIIHKSKNVVKGNVRENNGRIRLEDRINGEELLNAIDTIKEIRDIGGRVDNYGYVTLFHATNNESARSIVDSKKMRAKEDGLFFSTKANGEIRGYGKYVLKFKIPVEMLEMNDVFHDEIHFRLPLKNKNESIEVSDYLIVPKNMQNTAENAQEGKKSIPGTRLSELVEKYGAIPSGENPAREVQVPKKTADGRKVSQTVRTILEAKATPDEAVPTIEKMVEDGIFSYDVYTDKQALDEANSNIKKYGWDESVGDWFKDVEKGVVSKQHTAMGWALYNNAANIAATTTSETERTSAIKTSLKILDAMVRHQRSAAQALQATRILKKLSPETQLYAAQKSVQAFQKELSDRYGDKAPNLEIDEELAEQFLNAKTPEERAEIETKIYKDIGRQMPSRFVDKWNAWRYLAMLGNVRTHVRNIGGNAFFAPVVMTKDLGATAIESIVHRVSGKKTVRGKALITGSKADRALLKAAWGDYGNVADLISNGGKYSDFAMANQKIEDGRQIFKFKPLELARKGNSALLEKEDMWFSKPHYAYALAQYCKANNITAEQIKRGKAIAPARDYAIKEAQKATYRDTNAFSQFVSDLGKNGKVNYVPKPVSMIVDGILPFRKTPANILVRGVEYSPLGLLKGLSYDLYQVSKGKMSATEAIDNISAGLTGTGLLGFGVYLAAQGLIRGHGEDDEEEKEFKELMGHQSYALELPNGQSITLDWLAPEALTFFVGVNIWETTKGSDEEVTLSTILNAIRNITEPMLEMSCLQGLNDLFEGIGYAKSNDTSALVAFISSAVKSYLMQGLPTILGQAERTGEEHRMTTYTEKDDFLTGDMQYTLGKASAKIPFWDYHQIPYIDAWGRKEASGVALKRGLNNFLNPAYTSTVEASKMEKELLRLYESTGEASVFPSRADKYFTVDKKRKDLTTDEYVRYATLKGKKSYKLITDLVQSDAYKLLDDGEKVKAIEEAYDYANQKAKEAISNYKPDTWVSKADEFSDVGSYITFRTEVSATKKENGDKISRQEVADIILDMAQNDSDMWNMYLSMYDSKGDKYAYDSGVSGEAYMYFLETLNEVDTPNKSGKYGTYTQAEATAAVNQLEGLSREEQRALWQSVNTTWKRNPF